ncbi:response regulator [Dyadobacter flavalbus]|uniref:Response regulator n=1 Tax=Dyadobacter flavalbus TaxID=2579942 RepID=A0A5M8QXA9_9BACT|nr:response regulator [Dyadobacter flavalbus]KAA6439053.1 response regulator [Dyadobacter flavalbus]
MNEIKNSIKTIYIVDDDDDDRMLMKEAIESVIGEIDIYEISDAVHMMELINNKTICEQSSLILMDMNMPRVSGLEILTHIKANDSCSHIPVVMISTSSSPDLINNAYELGINAYITKPVTAKEYIELAEAVSICFLNNNPFPKNAVIPKDNEKKTILIIEDSPDQTVLMSHAIKNTLHNVTIYEMDSSESTMEFFNDHWKTLQVPPQLIILDLYMPERKDGLQLLKSIREFLLFNNINNIPIVVFSFSDDREDIDESYRNQASAYLTKSVDYDNWLSYFQHLIHAWWNVISLPKKPSA